MPDPVPSLDRINTRAAIVGPLAIVILFIWMTNWTGEDASSALPRAIGALTIAVPWAAAWLIAAFGFGRLALRASFPLAKDRLLLQLALGIAALILIDVILGVTGLLQTVGAWIVLAIGVGLAAQQFVRWLKRNKDATIAPPNWMIWLAAPAIAVLIIAACSAPGWLWLTERGGFDALSYHLQLPREWLELGRITPLDHNVYSHLPGYMEAAYYHLMVLIGDPTEAAYACQMLHACLAIITAIIVGKLAMRFLPSAPDGMGRFAAILFITTPWVIVVGSLAYNEITVCLLFATGLLVIEQADARPIRRAILVGALAALACGAKLTALGFVAAPLAFVLLWRTAPRHWLKCAGAGFAAAVICLMPWFINNAHDSGNPVFPFATSLFGEGHWTSQQLETFRNGHIADIGFGDRLQTGFNELFRFGIGPSPDPTEPWVAQWSILWWLAPIALIIAFIRPPTPQTRRRAVQLTVILAIQLIFWLGFTHLKSRFMLPAAVPLALAISLAIPLRKKGSGVFFVVGASVAVLALAVWPVVIYSGEGAVRPVIISSRETDHRPSALLGNAGILDGDRFAEELADPALAPADHLKLLASAPPAYFINHTLPAGSSILFLGEARPFHYRGDITWRTTWDRGPLSAILDNPDLTPEAQHNWPAVLAAEPHNFTHILINYEMLENWERSGWNDPAITLQRIRATINDREINLRTIREWPGRDITITAGLYALPQ